MPRPGPRRPILGIRLDPDIIAGLDAIATATGTTRSDVARDAITRSVNRRTKIVNTPTRPR